jgi:hypothetical protein
MPTHARVANVLQVLNYDDFVSKPLSKKPAHMSAFNSSDHSHCTSICGDKLDHVAPIAILNTSLTGIGPQQCEILQVQTSKFTIQTSISTHQLYCLWLQTFTFLKRSFKINLLGMKFMWVFNFSEVH